MIILGLISLLLDLTILNFSNYLFGNINLFFPYLTLVYIISYFYFGSIKKSYFIYIVIFLYSIMVNNNIVLTFILMGILYWFVIYIKGNFKEGPLFFFIVVVLSLIIYDVSYFLILVLFNCLSFNIFNLFYKVYNSIFLNLFYGVILYFLVPVLIAHKK